MERIESAGDWLITELAALLEESHPAVEIDLRPIIGRINSMTELAVQILERRSVSTEASCRILAQLLRHEPIEAMIHSGASPEAIRASRRHRSLAFSRCLRMTKKRGLANNRRLSSASADSGEWVCWGQEQLRFVRLLYHLTKLGWMGRAFRMGFRVDANSTVKKLGLLQGYAETSRALAER